MNAAWCFQRGRADFKAGRPCPSRPAETDTSPAAWRWMGWRVAFGADWMKRRDIAEYLGCPVPEIKEPPPSSVG